MVIAAPGPRRTTAARRPRGAARTQPATRREARLVRGACGLIAAPQLWDAFLAPAPGTAPADHLASGLVPVALLLLLAWSVPRAPRAGVRASAMLALGAAALVAGIGAPVRELWLRGAGVSALLGLAATLAAAALAVAGVRLLWRSRRLDEPRPRRYLRRVLVGAAAVVVAFELVAPLPFAYLATHRVREPAAAGVPGAGGREVTITTADGLRLRGTYLPSRNGAALLVLPRRTGAAHARMLAGAGYGVLLLDRRGEGASEGAANALGYGGGEDVRAAIAWLRERSGVAPGRVGGLGLSVGGELLLEEAARDDGLRAVVADGAGIRSLREQIAQPGAGRWVTTPFWALTSAAAAVWGDAPIPPALQERVAEIAPRPVLLIWARHGNGEEINRTYLARAGARASGWEIADAGHTGGLTAHPEAYAQRLTAFLDRALAP